MSFLLFSKEQHIRNVLHLDMINHGALLRLLVMEFMLKENGGIAGLPFENDNKGEGAI